MAVDEIRDQTGIYKSDMFFKLVQGIKSSKRSNFCRPGKTYVKSSNFFMVLTFIIFSDLTNMCVWVRKRTWLSKFLTSLNFKTWDFEKWKLSKIKWIQQQKNGCSKLCFQFTFARKLGTQNRIMFNEIRYKFSTH